MANISAAQVKELREKTGAPMMDCKQALTEAKGDMEQAVVVLRKKGVSVAAKKAARVTSEGSVGYYIHAGGKIGVLVEVNCESDFVARTDDFKELVHDISMHIAASDPKFVRKEDVTPEAFEREKDIYRAQAAATGKPAPVVEKIVGEAFFGAMARVFVVERPPRMPLLATYGDDFAAFIAGFEPARELPYLADVARLEAARTRAYHAADATPLDAGRFAALDAGLVGGIRVDLHPSAEIVRSPHPIVTIWAMNSGQRALAPIEDWRGEDAIVVRPYLDVEVRILPPGGAAFLLSLAKDMTLGEAAEAAVTDCSEFDLTRNLAGLIGWGLVQDLILPEPQKHGLP